jgi:hypothetical protein
VLPATSAVTIAGEKDDPDAQQLEPTDGPVETPTPSVPTELRVRLQGGFLQHAHTGRRHLGQRREAHR